MTVDEWLAIRQPRWLVESPMMADATTWQIAQEYPADERKTLHWAIRFAIDRRKRWGLTRWYRLRVWNYRTGFRMDV